MKRLPLVVSFLLFVALCAALAYWSLQLFKPPSRPVAAPPRTAQAEVRPEAASALFGGRAEKVAVASNYQLHGVIFSGTPRDSVAILSADGKPAQAIRASREVVPGVTVEEVHRDYVLLSEGGVAKRVELPESAKGQVELSKLAPVPVQPSPPPGAPIPSRAQAAAAAAGMTSGQTSTPVTPSVTPPSPTPPPAQGPGTPGAPSSSASPIPSGIVPSVQPPAAVPPTVVVSPPPSAQAGASAPAPAAQAAPAAPAPTAPAPAMQPAAPAAAPGFPPRSSSSGSAPLISR